MRRSKESYSRSSLGPFGFRLESRNPRRGSCLQCQPRQSTVSSRRDPGKLRTGRHLLGSKCATSRKQSAKEEDRPACPLSSRTIQKCQSKALVPLLGPRLSKPLPADCACLHIDPQYAKECNRWSRASACVSLYGMQAMRRTKVARFIERTVPRRRGTILLGHEVGKHVRTWVRGGDALKKLNQIELSYSTIRHQAGGRLRSRYRTNAIHGNSRQNSASGLRGVHGEIRTWSHRTAARGIDGRHQHV